MTPTEIINYIPVVISICIFLSYLRANKNIKKLEVGPLKYEAKDNAGKGGAKNNGAKLDKDIKQDEVIENINLKLENLEKFIERDAIDRKKRQDDIDTRLDKQYEYIREAAMQAALAIVWNDSIPFVERTKAAFLAWKLGANGNLRKKYLSIVMVEPNGKVTFESELSAYMRANEKNLTPHFRQAIKWLEKQIH